MDVNNYTLEMRLKFCKVTRADTDRPWTRHAAASDVFLSNTQDLRILAEQIEETKQRILGQPAHQLRSV